jgi:protein tyrosine phosphatase (PTP) superfamily phosphohydrolase (DUF442 family)
VRDWSLRIALALAVAGALVWSWKNLAEKRVKVVEPGRLVRGAWQKSGPLRRLIDREQIRTIVTLTAINRDDPKYITQERVVRQTGVDWVIVPMRGSTATLEQMAEAADLLADPARQPVFFHCVGGHHRTSLAHAAYRIRHQGWSAERVWAELLKLRWTRPDARSDQSDHALIKAFARAEAAHRQPGERIRKDAMVPDSQSRSAARSGRAGPVDLPGLAVVGGELRDR